MTTKPSTVASLTLSFILNANYAFADEPVLLQPSDLNYIGAFRVNYVNQEEGRLGFAPARIAVNSATNSFL